MVISAMATPDASPVTMLLMFGAMIVLYEASLLVARIVLGNRLKRQEEEAREAAEDAEIAAEWDETKKKARRSSKNTWTWTTNRKRHLRRWRFGILMIGKVSEKLSGAAGWPEGKPPRSSATQGEV